MDQFPQNRYAALEEAQKLLGFKQAEFTTLFRIMRKAEDCILQFSLGDLSVRFMLWAEDGEEKKIHMSFDLDKRRLESSITHEFSLRELENFSQNRQLQIDSPGDD